MTDFDRWWLDTLGPLANADAAYTHAKMAWEAATAAEREACARVCEARYMGDNNREDVEARACAAAIRAR